MSKEVKSYSKENYISVWKENRKYFWFSAWISIFFEKIYLNILNALLPKLTEWGLHNENFEDEPIITIEVFC